MDKIYIIYMISCRKLVNCYSWDAMEACKIIITHNVLPIICTVCGFKTESQRHKSCVHTVHTQIFP